MASSGRLGDQHAGPLIKVPDLEKRSGPVIPGRGMRRRGGFPSGHTRWGSDDEFGGRLHFRFVIQAFPVLFHFHLPGISSNSTPSPAAASSTQADS